MANENLRIADVLRGGLQVAQGLGLLGNVQMPGEGLPIPGTGGATIDILTPSEQAAGGCAANLMSPVKVTASGNVAPKPFVTCLPTRSGGVREEWYVPAGKPTGFTKVTRKKRRRCCPR